MFYSEPQEKPSQGAFDALQLQANMQALRLQLAEAMRFAATMQERDAIMVLLNTDEYVIGIERWIAMYHQVTDYLFPRLPATPGTWGGH